jgi:hypothetical protein
MYDADIQSMDAAAKVPEVGCHLGGKTGFLYDSLQFQSLESKRNGTRNGNYMLGVTQMIPNASKLKADFNLMNAMSSVEKRNKKLYS